MKVQPPSWLLLLFALQMADVATTWASLTHTNHHEGNPIGVFLIEHGYTWMVAAKLLATTIIGLLAFFMAHNNPRGKHIATMTLRGSCGLMLLIITNNVTKLT